MIAANVSTWEGLYVCFVDAGLEALGCQDEVCLVVNLPIRDMSGCHPRQYVGVDRAGKVSGWLFANSKTLHPLSFDSPMPNLPAVPAQCWCASGPTLLSSFL